MPFLVVVIPLGQALVAPLPPRCLGLAVPLAKPVGLSVRPSTGSALVTGISTSPAQSLPFYWLPNPALSAGPFLDPVLASLGIPVTGHLLLPSQKDQTLDPR